MQQPLSLSLSLSTIFPFIQHKNIPSTTLQPSKLKFPTQASSLTHLSLSTTTSLPLPSKTSFKFTIPANPLHAPLSLVPHRPRDPSNAAALHRAALVWFCNDLRLLDNECLTAANNDSLSVLPVYCFDPFDYGKSTSGFDKTDPYRTAVLIDSISDLYRSLQACDSNLVVRVGKPKTVLVELAKALYPKVCKRERREKLLEMMKVR
ncbi:Blue-light photoreceptor PHR2 [Glycine soja]